MLVTVAMPVYNGEQYIRQAIQGVLDQTFQDFELLIINDASTDGTLAAIDEYADPRIRLVDNAKNIGGYGNFNKCLSLASGKYIFFNHQDDVMMPDLLEKATAICENDADISCCGVNAVCIDENNTALGLFFSYSDRDILFSRDTFLDSYFTQYSMAIASTLIRMDVIRKNALCFSEKEGNASDMVFWVRLALCSERLYFMQTPLFHRRIHHGQWSRDFCTTKESFKDLLFKTYMTIFSCILGSQLPDESKLAYINVYLSEIPVILSRFPSPERAKLLKKTVTMLTSTLKGTPFQIARTVLRLYKAEWE